MLQTRHDQIVLTIQCWRRASQILARESGAARDQVEPLIRAVRDRLALHDSMPALLSAFDRQGGAWPVGLDRPLHLSDGAAADLVAAAYWMRYQELLSRANHTVAGLTSEPEDGHTARPVHVGPVLGRIELQYTVKLWQRGPLWLRALPPDRRARAERLVGRIYARIADAKSVNDLASRYYADGEWILSLARGALTAIGEPSSSVSLAQDCAFWQRYQELLAAVNASQWRSRDTEARTAAFATWLGNHMADQKTSVAELAQRLGVTEDAIRGWLQGRDRPTPDITSRLAVTLVSPGRQATQG
jgi:hypothetical protein